MNELEYSFLPPTHLDCSQTLQQRRSKRVKALKTCKEFDRSGPYCIILLALDIFDFGGNDEGLPVHVFRKQARIASIDALGGLIVPLSNELRVSLV
jgi:hypothetical protein